MIRSTRKISFPCCLTDAGRLLGCATSTISRWVDRLSIGTRVGTVVLLSEGDVESLRQVVRDKPGNPGKDWLAEPKANPKKPASRARRRQKTA